MELYSLFHHNSIISLFFVLFLLLFFFLHKIFTYSLVCYACKICCDLNFTLGALGLFYKETCTDL